MGKSTSMTLITRPKSQQKTVKYPTMLKRQH